MTLTRELMIKEKRISLYCSKQDTAQAKLPLVVLNTCNNEGAAVFDKCLEAGCQDFILAAVSGLDWEQDMSPWHAAQLDKNHAKHTGKADLYLELLTEEILPKLKNEVKRSWAHDISCYALAGYSLAGLFAVYAAYRTDLFEKIACASGSFWFPGFVEFAGSHDISPCVRKIYFSLGRQESSSKNRRFASVGAHTKELEKLYSANGIKTVYEENEGGHFQNTDRRMAKGILWMLE